MTLTSKRELAEWIGLAGRRWSETSRVAFEILCSPAAVRINQRIHLHTWCIMKCNSIALVIRIKRQVCGFIGNLSTETLRNIKLYTWYQFMRGSNMWVKVQKVLCSPNESADLILTWNIYKKTLFKIRKEKH